jgi:hypothetical protein
LTASCPLSACALIPKRIRIILLALLLPSCGLRIAALSEIAITPAENQQQWWFVNGVLNPSSIDETHFLALFSLEPSEKGKFLSCFAARYNVYAKRYSYGYHQSDSVSISNTGRFPVALKIFDTGTNADAGLYLNRRSGMLRLPIHEQGALSSGGIWRLSWRHVTQRPFKLSSLSASPEVWTVAPLKLKKPQKGWAHTVIVRNGEELILQKDNTAVFILSLAIRDAGHVDLLGIIGPDGSAQIMGAQIHNDNGGLGLGANIGISLQQEGNWQSAETQKIYPLSILMKTDGQEFQIRALASGQEIPLGRRSFWMGGVEAISPLNRAPIGSGNMAIFVNR